MIFEWMSDPSAWIGLLTLIVLEIVLGIDNLVFIAILAEKLQTVLARGLLNTRMRDFYDIKTLLSIYEQDIDADVLKKAFEATCKKRSTENLKEEAPKIMAAVSDDAQLHTLWKSYQKKYPYATDISYEDIMESTMLLWSIIQ